MEATPDIDEAEAHPASAPSRRPPRHRQRLGRPKSPAATTVDAARIAGIVETVTTAFRSAWAASRLSMNAVDKAIGGKNCTRFRNWMNGKCKSPSLDTLAQTAAALDISLREMMPSGDRPPVTRSEAVETAAWELVNVLNMPSRDMREVMAPAARDKLLDALVDAQRARGGGDV